MKRNFQTKLSEKQNLNISEIKSNLIGNSNILVTISLLSLTSKYLSKTAKTKFFNSKRKSARLLEKILF